MEHVAIHLHGIVLHVLDHRAVGRVGAIGSDGGLRLLYQVFLISLVLGFL